LTSLPPPNVGGFCAAATSALAAVSAIAATIIRIVRRVM
jgi:hypothetical protein